MACFEGVKAQRTHLKGWHRSTHMCPRLTSLVLLSRAWPLDAHGASISASPKDVQVCDQSRSRHSGMNHVREQERPSFRKVLLELSRNSSVFRGDSRWASSSFMIDLLPHMGTHYPGLAIINSDPESWVCGLVCYSLSRISHSCAEVLCGRLVSALAHARRSG